VDYPCVRVHRVFLLNVVAGLMPASHRQSGRDGGLVTKRLTRANGDH
jgi:hypothetical protein